MAKINFLELRGADAQTKLILILLNTLHYLISSTNWTKGVIF